MFFIIEKFTELKPELKFSHSMITKILFSETISTFESLRLLVSEDFVK